MNVFHVTLGSSRRDGLSHSIAIRHTLLEEELHLRTSSTN